MNFEKPQEPVSDSKEIISKKEINEGFNWNAFWRKEGYATPLRKEVFPNQEDLKMSDEDVVKHLNNYLTNSGYNFDNMTGINAEEFPEMIDKDIRDVCVKLNKLDFLKTKEGCGGHERNIQGDFFEAGYAEPYLVFYAEENNVEFEKFLKKINEKIAEFKSKKIPGIENAILYGDKFSTTSTDGIARYRFELNITPTEEWCMKNNKEYIKRPFPPKFYPEWCEENGFEFIESEEYNDGSEPRIRWEKEKEEYQQQKNKFLSEYSQYFRSEEVRKIRDEFFKIFYSSLEE